MSIDLNKLTPAPWVAQDSRHESECWSLNGKLDLESGIVGWHVIGGYPDDPLEGWAVIHGEAGNGTIVPQRTDLEFIALARNAFAGDPEALAWWEANRVKIIATNTVKSCA